MSTPVVAILVVALGLVGAAWATPGDPGPASGSRGLDIQTLPRQAGPASPDPQPGSASRAGTPSVGARTSGPAAEAAPTATGRPPASAAGNERASIATAAPGVAEPEPPAPEAPTPRPYPASVAGPGGCDGVDAMLAATRSERRLGAEAADPSSRSDRLGQYLLFDSPYQDARAIYHGPMNRSEVEHGSRSWRETPGMFEEHGFTAAYTRGWTSQSSWQTSDGWALVLYVWELASTQDAVAFDEASLRNACQQTKATFTVPGVRGAVGISQREVGAPVADEVTFVRGPRRYAVVLELNAHDGYDRPAQLARRQDGAAR